MKTTIFALGVSTAAMLSTHALAALSTGDVPAPVVAREEPIRLAQAREVDIVIDERGRELVIDARTGQVLAIRQRGLEPQFSPYERRRQRARELDRDGYPDRDALLGERLDRELEVRLGMREAPDSGEEAREFRRMQRERYPRDGYPVEGWEGRYGDDAVAREELPPYEDGDEIAAFPDAPQPPTIVEPAQPQEPAFVPPAATGPSEQVAKIQILLDRHGVSPGVIDGRMGDNVNKAISAWRDKSGNALRTYDDVAIEAALAESGGDAFATYEITPVDAAGPFVASVPEDYGEKAQLDRLGFTSVSEMLAERFHMDENYLKAINPGIDFTKPGGIVKVANVGAPVTGKVARIIADKGRKQVRGYDETGRLLVAYPATIGSSDTPSPIGTHTVERVAFDPEYTYNPKVNFQQGANDKVLRIPPGPNGPVGTIWIALSKPTYGIHGTPEPSRIGKTNSHGCVRLTNWDAAELAKMVGKGVTVEFLE
jgi:lipoprotein-anchoring transpeptidase ErfK/SrfK